MDPSFQAGGKGVQDLEVLWEDGERALCRRPSQTEPTMVLVLVAEHPSPASVDCLTHELALKNERGRIMLVLEDSGGEPLARILGAPLPVEQILSREISIAVALG